MAHLCLYTVMIVCDGDVNLRYFGMPFSILVIIYFIINYKLFKANIIYKYYIIKVAVNYLILIYINIISIIDCHI